MPLTYGNLSENLCKEKLSLAYVEAVAAVAGCVTAREDPDIGVDISIRQSGSFDLYTDARLDIQAKSTASPQWAVDSLAYDLRKKNYDDLRDPQVYVPRILVVLIVPAEREQWIVHSEDLTELRNNAYWASLRGDPESDNENTQRVFLPSAQRFTVEALCDMLTAVGNNEQL